MNQPISPSRRSVLRASAWAVPAVAVVGATPAFAQSPRLECQPMTYQLNWAQQGAWAYTLANENPGNGTGQLLATAAQAPQPDQVLEDLPIVFTNTFYGRMRRQEDDGEGNMIVTTDQVGGTGAPGLEMWQIQSSTGARSANTVHNDRQTITFDFGRPVTNLRFTISDLDSQQPAQPIWGAGQGQYRDAVYVSQQPTSVTLGDRVTGVGTQANPWTPNVAPNNAAVGTANASGLDNHTSNRGNVNLHYAGPIQALSVTFYNTETRALTASGSQAIYFSNFTFNANSCVNPYS